MDNGKISRAARQSFDAISIIAPGLILILGIVYLRPEISQVIPSKGITVGDFGILTIIAFTVGHILHGLANLFESFLWGLAGGFPTTQVLTGNKNLLTGD